MSKLKVKRAILFKHGVAYFILEGAQKGAGTFELEFKINEMNDILKSLFVLDTSEKGYISSISYDAAIETSKLLEAIMLDIPDTNSFSSLLTQIKGADITLTIGNDVKKITGTIMGIEYLDKMKDTMKITEKMLTILTDGGVIQKIAFSEISKFEILNEDLKNDLKFFLDTVIAGKKKDSKKIVIHCESGGDDSVERSIIVSFIRESPVWKTSYRLIMSKEQAKEQKCLLSAWALVENTTNSDWNDIELSLVAGMPVSFIYNFYRPIFINRPKIEPPKILSAKPTEIEDGLETEIYKELEEEVMAREEPKMRKRSVAKPMAAQPPPAPGGAARFAATGAMDMSTIKNKMSSATKTSTKDLGELFEYNITNPVTIHRKQSALVPILTEEIIAKKILLYNRNEHGKNPDACLEVTNNTDLTLERGPVTIIYDDNLAGEAIIPFLNKEDTRILNYAVEQAVIINHEQKSENQNVHRLSFGGGYSYEYYYTDMYSEYKIRNKTKEEKELYLDHPKTYGYEIKESPREPEETANYWRFKMKLGPKDAISFKIKERKENYSSYYLYYYSEEDLRKRIEFYVRKKFIAPEIETKLKEIAELIGNRKDLEAEKAKLEDERYQMEQEQNRIRENIKVLGDTSHESGLKEKYIKKLAKQEERFENISAQIKDLEKKLESLNKSIEEKIQAIKLS